jgi:drug/metabolite transporter (DMT)-like permease
MVVLRRHREIPMVPAACLSALLGTIVSLPFASPWAASAMDLGYLVLFRLVQMTLCLTLFTIGSRLIPAVATALTGALDAPLGPWWVWLAFGEVPAAVTFLGGALVLSAGCGHMLAEARPKAARIQSRESRREPRCLCQPPSRTPGMPATAMTLRSTAALASPAVR